MSEQRSEKEIIDEAYGDESAKTWRAPVQGYPAGIPWPIHLEAYAAYCKRWSKQTAMIDLKGRHCRGGFSTGELDELVPGWLDRVSYIGRLEARIAELETAEHSPVSKVETFNPAHGSKATADQMSAVMLQHGTPEQQREALNLPPQPLPTGRLALLEEAIKLMAMDAECSEEQLIEDAFALVNRPVPKVEDSPVSSLGGLPQDVINLVIAAREAFDTGGLPIAEGRELDKALEPFSSRVPYENKPDDCLSTDEQKAQGARCGCKGSNEYCGCQNTPDNRTLAARSLLNREAKQ